MEGRGGEIQKTKRKVKRLEKIKDSYFQKQAKEDYENDILMSGTSNPRK